MICWFSEYKSSAQVLGNDYAQYLIQDEDKSIKLVKVMRAKKKGGRENKDEATRRARDQLCLLS